MNRTNAIRSLLLSLTLATAAFAAPAYADISFNINVAPPAPQYEAVPNIAPGYVWAPGYWGWTGDHHVWVRGRPIMQREGYRWEPDSWQHRDSGYYRTAGHWENDRSYKPVKAKQNHMAHDEHGDHSNRGHEDSGKHGKGGKHED